MFLQRLPRRLAKSYFPTFHTSVPSSKQDVAVFRTARMMKKLMTGSSRPRKKFFTVEQTPQKQLEELKFLESKGKFEKRTYSNKAKHRVKVLNVIFVEQITSLLSTGEVGNTVLELGLNVTRVKISPDFSQVSVYWKPSGTEADVALENELKRVGGHLRHELTQLRVIGIVPPIVFVKDPIEDKLRQVEYALSKCDFGEDYVPTDIGAVIKTMDLAPLISNANFSLDINSGAEINEMSSNHQDSTVETKQWHQSPVTINSSLNQILDPPMRQDILGLDRAVIMKKILDATDKTKRQQKYISILTAAPVGTDSMNKDPASRNDDNERKKHFIKYLNEKRYEKERRIKRESSEAKNREFQNQLRLELMQTVNDALYDDVKEHEDLDDYVEDEL